MDARRREALLKEYSEVNSNFRLLTDIRFKLLALLPIAAAAAAALKGDGLGLEGMGFSLFGLVATLGLATYNARNDQLYNELIGRAASIELSLGLQDGAFANRPRPWLSLGGRLWPIDHGTGITTIYAASVALWAYGVLAPIFEFARRGSLHLGFTMPDLKPFGSADPALMVRMLAFLFTIILTVSGTYIIGKHNRKRSGKLRCWAAEAVHAAEGLTMADVATHDRLLSLCVNLSGAKRETVELRAQFYTKLDPESLCHYLPSGSREFTAAHTVALLTDFPARWLFDCATNRRGVKMKEVPAAH